MAKNNKSNTKIFTRKAIKLHNHIYDYSKVEYVNAKTKVCIICKEHGEFWQTPDGHLSGKGCKKCGIINSRYKKMKTQQEFLDEVKKIHGDKYLYEKLKYSGITEPVSLVCKSHGVFKCTARNLLLGEGCLKCRYAKSGLSKNLFHLNKRDWDFEQPEEYKLIPLISGKFTMVDNEDFEKVRYINWCDNAGGYAVNNLHGSLHRLITDAPDDMLVDHINHDTLDNRKSNLRVVTHHQNSTNSKPAKNNSSKYKGVTWNKGMKKWQANLRNKGVFHYLGRFINEEEAGRAYDRKAKELFGEFAYLNFPNEEVGLNE